MKKTRRTVGQPNDELSFVALENVIGKPGEQGEAWKARSTAHGTLKFAVKIGRTPLDSRARRKDYEEFQREFRTLASLNHPNIVKVFDCGIFKKNGKEYPFYIMEFLGDNVKTFGRTALRDKSRRKIACLQAFFETADALRYFHLKIGGFHSDIKESNTLIGPREDNDFSVKLIDFGFARLLRDPSAKDERAKAGRIPQKLSSVPRPARAKSEKHSDIWQLCFIIKRALDECAESNGVAGRGWPIDTADYKHLLNLLSAWGSTEQQSPAETGDLTDFYSAVQDFRERLLPKEIDPDFRGALRFLAIPEIATVAKCLVAAHSIRIPPRRLVLYTDRIAELLATDQMTKLGNTRQLGFTHLVYPGAHGTRLEHSLGVYEMACHFIVRMSSQAAFRSVCPDPKDCLLFVVAALLHDIGHFPFAHQLEEFTKDDFDKVQWQKVRTLLEGKHERRSCEIIGDELAPALKRLFAFSDGDMQRLILFIKKFKDGSDDQRTVNQDPALGLLRSIIGGAVDIDKLDYIERDAYHCGVPYGSYIDVERIFETMRIVEDKTRKMAHAAFDQRGVGCLEQLVTARHQLYANVYWHRAVRAATAMFKHLFYLFQDQTGDRSTVEKVFFESGSDLRCLSQIEEFAKRHVKRGVEKNAMLHLACVVSGRKRALYKAVVQRDHTQDEIKTYGEHMYGQQRVKAAEICRILKKKGMWDAEFDALGEHNVLIDCRADKWPDFDRIKIINTLGEEVPLARVAPTVEDLGKSFDKQACRIRVFVNVGALKPQFRDKIGRRHVEQAIASELE
jgi:uncharacterized protein